MQFAGQGGAQDPPRAICAEPVEDRKQKPVQRSSAAELGLTSDELVPTQSVVAVHDAPAKAAGEVVPAGAETTARIADLLAEAKVI